MHSFKRLEDVFLKTTYDIKEGNFIAEAGETLAHFDEIQISGFNELTSTVSARGGFDNRPHVSWTSTREIDLTFSRGVFSDYEFSLLNNARLQVSNEVPISYREKIETENGDFTLERIPIDKVYCYLKKGDLLLKKQVEKIGEKDYQIIDFEIQEEPSQIVVDYTYLYTGENRRISIGNRFIGGLLSLEGKTTIKDEEGVVTSGVIKIPKLKISTNLSMRLGDGVSPHIISFYGQAFPKGNRGVDTVMDFYFLDNDVTAVM